MSIVKWGRTIQEELSRGSSRVIDHEMQAEFDGHSWTVEFPVYIDCTYQQGKYDEEGIASRLRRRRAVHRHPAPGSHLLQQAVWH